MDVILGSEFEQHNVLRKISEGLTSNVYQLLNKNNGEFLALKKFKSTCKVENRKKEISIQSTLTHDGIVRVEQYDEVHHDWIILEHHGTSDLFDVISALREPLSEAATKYLFKQILVVITYLHQQGVYHRDIKLENLLFCQESLSVKLCDFGFSVHHDEGKVSRCVGTLGYIAPEIQIDHETSVDAATLAPTDVFALGSLLFTLVFGHQAFKDTKRMSCAYWRMIEENKWDKYWSLVAKYNPVRPSHQFKQLMESILTVTPTTRITLEDVCTSEWMRDGCATREEVLCEIRLKTTP